jgi:hypothetical protein
MHGDQNVDLLKQESCSLDNAPVTEGDGIEGPSVDGFHTATPEVVRG